MTAERRNSDHGTAEPRPDASCQAGGVGARQGSPGAPRQGGEYQNNCTFFETSDEENSAVKIADLKKMGLSSVWTDMAERIGVQAFLEIWALLDATVNDCDRRLRVPRLTSLHRHFRNQLILSLRDEGYSPNEIVDYIKINLQTTITPRTVYRTNEESSNLPPSFHGQTS